MTINEGGKKITFNCPNCGEIDEVDVAFVCNTCNSTEAKHIDGMYICKQCEITAHPLECRICGSKDVTMHSAHIDLPNKTVGEEKQS